MTVTAHRSDGGFVYTTTIGTTTLVAGSPKELDRLIQHHSWPCLSCGKRCCTARQWYCGGTMCERERARKAGTWT